MKDRLLSMNGVVLLACLAGIAVVSNEIAETTAWWVGVAVGIGVPTLTTIAAYTYNQIRKEPNGSTST